VGKQLSALLDKPDLSEKVVEETLKALIRQQSIVIQSASKLAPPGPLRQEHAQMLEALQLRRNALSGLLTVFKKTFSKRGSVEATNAAVALSSKMLRGVASDVLWEDMFVAAAQNVLKREGISGVSPPDSVFVADPTRATINSMAVVWQRFHGVQTSNSTSGLVHGTNIAYVKVLPSGETLTEGSAAPIITANNRLAIAVGVKNGGDYTEEGIKVTLLINQTPQPIKQSETIGQIYSHNTTEVVFKNIAVTELAKIVPISIDVAPVAGETNKTNNKATFEVRFSF